MRKVFAFLLVMMMVGGTAFAVAPDSRAIGWENGLSYKAVTSALVIQAVLNFERYTPDDDDSETDLGISGFVSNPLWTAKTIDLSWFGGLSYAKEGWNDDDWVALSVGLQPEYFISPNLAVSAKWGLSVEFGDGWKWFGIKGSNLGQLAIHLYFQ